MTSDQHHIDQLLERYLILLDEYTQLRNELSSLQADVYHNIARANFSAERGMRYGQDHYDERMQAVRHVVIRQEESGISDFKVMTRVSEAEDSSKDETSRTDLDEETESGANGDKGQQGTKKQKSNDPLRWFGILTPMPLRTAQSSSIRAVQDVIPRLVSISAEMHHVEIEVRRARKRRAKAAALRGGEARLVEEKAV